MSQQVDADIQVILIPQIRLSWSHWVRWSLIALPVRGDRGISVPYGPGVYEARYEHEEERLTIGKGSSLYYRVKQGMVKGKLGHPAGTKIREQEDTSRIVVRWAITDRPSAVEEELHRQHKEQFDGRLPKHTGFT